jgi:anti-anti-sigma factor
MSLNPVLHLEEQGVHIVAFHRDEHGVADGDQVRHYFSGDFLKGTAGVRRMVIDLSGIAALDSASLGPLVQKLREIQDLKGHLALAGVASPALREIFALTRFDKVFPIYPTRAEAVSAVASAG